MLRQRTLRLRIGDSWETPRMASRPGHGPGRTRDHVPGEAFSRAVSSRAACFRPEIRREKLVKRPAPVKRKRVARYNSQISRRSHER